MSVHPFPLGGVAAHVVDRLSPPRMSDPYLEAIAKCIEHQDALAELLLVAEQKGEPYPLATIESLRFNAAKVAGVCAFLLKQFAGPRTRSPSVEVRHGRDW